MSQPQLLKKIIITGEITAVTGLLIGASQSGMTIGGTDKQVIRDPVSQKPYIPGSSLKGKMRSLIELRDGTFGSLSKKNEFGPSNDATTASAQLFGFVGNKLEGQEAQKPSRLIVRDSHLANSEKLAKTEMLYTEVKVENGINRITSEANPRTTERVPAGAIFRLNMVLNVFSTDTEAALRTTLFEALRLVQDDYLGGGGSRGNGQVTFRITGAVERDADAYRTGDKGRDIMTVIPADLRNE